MPLFYYRCASCQNEFGKLLEPDEGKKPQSCPKCSHEAIRAPKAPSSQTTERIDNGLMSRAVVRIADAERIFRERSNKHTNRPNEE